MTKEGKAKAGMIHQKEGGRKERARGNDKSVPSDCVPDPCLKSTTADVLHGEAAAADKEREIFRVKDKIKEIDFMSNKIFLEYETLNYYIRIDWYINRNCLDAIGINDSNNYSDQRFSLTTKYKSLFILV